MGLPRIASLVPAGTEIAWALGLEAQLVAVTHDCDFPPAVRALPRVTASSIPPGTSSREIDRLVRSAGEHGDSTFHVDAGALRAARPDVILGQTICRVCAVTLDQLPVDLGAAPRTVPLGGTTLDGVLEDIRRVASALDVAERGETVVAGLRRRIAAVEERVAGRPRPRVACLEWLDPIFPGGHWVPEQVAIAGGIDALWDAGVPSIDVPWEHVIAAAPDVLVLMPCGFGTARAVADAPLIVERDGFADLPAARAGRVFATDGSAYFSRPGPRLVDGIEILAALLHPDLFPPPPADVAVAIPMRGSDPTPPLDATIERVLADQRALAADVRAGRPKAWGRLAALGVIAYRDLLGRSPSEAERRALWSGLWRAATATLDR